MNRDDFNIDEVHAELRRFVEQLPQTINDRFLNMITAGVVAKSKDDCPVDTGDLKRSIRGEVHEQESIIMAGDAGVGYAIQVHEDLNAHHDVGKAKFIQDNINALASDGPGNMAQVLANNLLAGLQ